MVYRTKIQREIIVLLKRNEELKKEIELLNDNLSEVNALIAEFKMETLRLNEINIDMKRQIISIKNKKLNLSDKQV